MAGRTANISSIDAVRAFQPALMQFEADVQDALMLLDLESRRPLDWIEHDRTRYWPREMHKASDAVNEARLAVERCELAVNPADRQSSYEARKMLENAKRRLRETEAKIEAVRKWRIQIKKEVEEFKVQSARMKHFVEADLQRSIAALERIGDALAGYVQSLGAGGETSGETRQNSEPSPETPASTDSAGASEERAP